MTAISVTNNTLTARDTIKAITATSSTSSEINVAEVFEFTPVKGADHCLIIATVANSHGTVAMSVAAGDFWRAIAVKTFNCVENATTAITLDTSKYLQDDGTISITATPASGKKLYTDHALSIEFIELPK